MSLKNVFFNVAKSPKIYMQDKEMICHYERSEKTFKLNVKLTKTLLRHP